ncbi:MAG TPA: ATP-binding protein [Pseudomonadales bacterium]
MDVPLSYLFLGNAGLLILLASFLVARKREVITWFFFGTTVGLAIWNICNFLIEERIGMSYLDVIVRLQLTSAMVFANGLYYFCSSYPVRHHSRVNLLNALVFAGLVFAIFLTDTVTDATLEGTEIVYQDGPGFVYYSIYIALMGFSSLYRLLMAWKRYPEHRSRIRYFFIGIFVYVSCAITFNLILPSLGIYDLLIVGRLSATLTPALFFYAVTKHDFLDVAVIINRGTAWFVTLVLMLGVTFTLEVLTSGQPVLNFFARCAEVFIIALGAHPLQQFLLTTAKRKFVRGWYSTEEIINRLSGRITMEKNREAIFKEVARVIDEVFELEDVMTIVAVRDEQENFSYYRIVGKFQRIRNDDPLIDSMRGLNECLRLEQASDAVLRRLEELQFGKGRAGMILPFHSPEFLEGVMVLGERSNQRSYSESDLRFFNNLINFLAPILYRLTPMEKLELLYSESRQKLHEAEIQLIRAQKIESIVHATRQCHHEIRTPLNIIKMGIGRIKTLEDLQNYKAVAQEEISHALEIVDETLTITEVDRASEHRATDINVNEVIQRCLRLIDRSRYKVELDLAEVPDITGVFSDIQVVVTNLIHNAMDAMPNGGTFAFSSRATASDVVITVEDSGEGIPESLRSKVWEPYFSGRGASVGNSTAGRGWGLTIVNRIVTAHQGTIRFTSEENVGTRFTITLPRKKTQDENSKGPHLSQAYP